MTMTIGAVSTIILVVCKKLTPLVINWLQVLDPAELAQIDQCVRQQLHAIMPLLDAFKA